MKKLLLASAMVAALVGSANAQIFNVGPQPKLTTQQQKETTKQQLPYYDSRGNVVGTVNSFDEFLDVAERKGSRIILLSHKLAAEDFAERVMRENRNPAATFATVAFSREDCGLLLHPMLDEGLEYFRKQQPIQLAYEIEKIRISGPRSSFCNIARAGMDSMTRTFDNLLFWQN